MVERLRPLAVGFVGTYPPTRCGIATFTAALARAVVSVDPHCRLGVVACVDPHSSTFGSSEVIAQLVRGSAASRAAAVERLNEFDVVVLQHEFGIYGGGDGGDVLDLVREVRVPVIVVLHTVPGVRRSASAASSRSSLSSPTDLWCRARPPVPACSSSTSSMPRRCARFRTEHATIAPHRRRVIAPAHRSS